MGKNGTKIKWDDRDVAREELQKLKVGGISNIN
jgi:hypothetical protein